MNNGFFYTLRRVQFLLTSFLLLTFIATSFAQTAAPAKSALTSDEKKFAEKISVKTIQEITNDLAAPAMEGRGTMQPGADKAANYLADRMAKMGMKPLGGDGTSCTR